MVEIKLRCGLLLLTCVRIFVETRLLIDVFPNVAVAGQRLAISCIFPTAHVLPAVAISKKTSGRFTTVYTIQYLHSLCRGGINLCDLHCSCSTDGKNLSWIIESTPETWHNTEWKCMHTTGHESDSVVYKLYISVPFTEIIISPDNTTIVDYGSRLLATCVTSPASRPAAKITWIKEKNGEGEIEVNATSAITYNVDDDKVISNSTLIFTPDKSDNGVIIFCTSTDVTGTKRKSNMIQIVVRSSPDNPRSLHFYDITSNGFDFSWIAGENNGYNQSFKIICKGGDQQSKVFYINEDTSKSVHQLSISNLSPSTVYEVSLFAWNKMGESPDVLIKNITTKKSELYDTSVAAIGGGCVTGMVIAILLGITIYKRKQDPHKVGDAAMDNFRVENEEDPDNVAIPYEPAEPYDNPLYAIATGHNENAKNVAEEINRTENKENGDDAYKSTDAVGGEVDEEHGEVNKTDPQLNAKSSRRKNKDGLVYIDVAILDSGNIQRKVVIRGIENRNDYAEVYFNRHDDLSDDDVDVAEDDDY